MFQAMDMNQLEQGAGMIRSAWREAHPRYGLILGSGWGDVVESFETRDSFPYGVIPGLGSTGVKGHEGRLIWASLAGKDAFVFQGRRHLYEGQGWTPVAFPIYLLKRFGCAAIVLTNAAGGIQDGSKPGDLMVVRDHIHMMGGSPLAGAHNSFWGRRFPDQSEVYDPAMRKQIHEAGDKAGIKLLSGVYMGVHGPTYETPAEIQAFKRLGADAVGMSTTPEATLANACGIKVAAVSCITNFASGMTEHKLSHDEVEEIGRKTLPSLRALIEELWRTMA